MRQFFKFTFASMVGFLLASIVSVILMVIFFTAVISFSSKETVTVKENSVLYLTLNHPVVDRKPNSPFSDFDFGAMKSLKTMGLNEITDMLERAGEDDRISGIYLEVSQCPFGLATAEEIREALLSFKKTGKFIIAYGDVISQKGYYLASVADKLYLNPVGLIDFKGISGQVAFIKGLSEKLKVEYQVFRPANNEYKSAVEPLIMDRMSEANKSQMGKMVNSLWSIITKNIEHDRGISVQNLNLAADSLMGFRASSALSAGLTDALIYKDQVIDTLKSLLHHDAKEKMNTITLAEYSRASLPKKKLEKSIGKDRIAVIYASGSIVIGDDEESVISSDNISKAIRKAREDKNIKAVVLRINSGGGDGLASEIIWREVKLCNDIKPVVVSMGDYAASGGYYIACPATKIVAQPNTLTGSIGVFGVVPNMQGLFNDHLGITFDEVNTNENAGFGNITRPMEPFEHRKIEMLVEGFYQTFLQRVADGRDMEIAAVDAIGQGRVWTGIDALELGLVDTLGGLQTAVNIAAREAGIENYRIYELPLRKDPFLKLMEGISGEASSNAVRNELGPYYKYFEALKEIRGLQGIQARMPFFIYLN